MNLVDQVTIIIPPHERHSYLRRVLDFIKDERVKIIIADSSSLPYPFLEELKLRKNISYFHLPKLSFTSKISKVIDKVNTPFVVLWAEDDFLNIKSLVKCTEFLQKNVDYHSCQGSYTRFIKKDDKYEFKHTYKISDNRDINIDDQFERLASFFKEYFQLFYAVHKTNNIRDLIMYAENKGIFNMFAIEIMIAYVAIARGKHRVLPIYFSSREVIATSVGFQKDNFEVFSTSEKYKTQYQDMLQFLNKLEIGSTNAEKIIKIYFDQTWKNIDILRKIKLKLRYFLQPKLKHMDAEYNEFNSQILSSLLKNIK